MITPDKLKELEDTIINFNEYLETITEGLKQLDIGVKAIVDDLRVEVKELSKGIEEIINGMKSDPAQGRTIVSKMLKILDASKTSTISTTSTMKLLTSPTTKPKQAFLQKREGNARTQR